MFRIKTNTVNPIFEETMEYFLPHFHLGNHKIEAGHRVHKDSTIPRVHIRVEKKYGECICPLSWSVHHNFVRDCRIVKGGGRARSHSPG
jgi:hypothetical protein